MGKRLRLRLHRRGNTKGHGTRSAVSRRPCKAEKSEKREGADWAMYRLTLRFKR